MKARKLIKRRRFLIHLNNEDAIYSPNVLEGYVLVTEGLIKAGDYFKQNSEQITWIKALGIVGCQINSQWASYVVCRPIQNL